MEEKPKVIVIGLDGATWDLIKPWTEEEKLPTFKYLMEKGAWGILESTIPPLSPSAWTSIYTGCKPSKHKIFGFTKRREGSYFYSPISSEDRKMPTIWETLSDYNKRSIIINALFSYPPKRVNLGNSVIITGLGTPSKDSNFVYPEDYRELILKKFPNYDVDFGEDLILISNDVNKFIAKIEDVTKEQVNLTKYFIENENWDFLFSIFRALDVLQHYFWNNKELLLRFYKLFDSFLNWLIENMGQLSYLFIVSDHGFTQVKKYFCVNNWLESMDMLKMENKKSKNVINAEFIKKSLLKIGARNIIWGLKRSVFLEKILRVIPSEEFGYLNKIKWSETKAYFYEGSDGIICINLKGREPNGIVSQDEHLEKYIITKLKEVTDPETDEKIVERIFTKEELFEDGDESLPDIFILLKDEYRAVGYNKIDNSLFMPPVHGKVIRPADHHIDGIFVSFGGGISNKILKNKMKTWDVAPTILHILGLPIPIDMDGKVLTGIFMEDSEFVKQEVRSQKETEKIKTKIKELKKIENV